MSVSRQWKGNSGKYRPISDMLVTEQTRVLCCNGMALQRKVGRFRSSFSEKTAVLGSVLTDHF